MKKILSLILSTLFCMTFLVACNGSTNSTTYNVLPQKPWGSYEKATYDFERTMFSTSELLSSGVMVYELIQDSNYTTLSTTFTVNEGDLTDTITSFSKFHTATMLPIYAEKEVNIATRESHINKDGSTTLYSYSFVSDYENETCTVKYYNERVMGDETPNLSSTTLNLKNLELNVYDSEIYYYLIRCASNLTEVGSSGYFSLVNAYDYVALYMTNSKNASYKTPIVYNVSASAQVVIPALINQFGIKEDGIVPCFKVTTSINGKQKGSGTTLYYTANEFGLGNKNVLACIERHDNDVVNPSSGGFLQKYTLSKYETTKA